MQLNQGQNNLEAERQLNTGATTYIQAGEKYIQLMVTSRGFQRTFAQ